MCNEAKIEITFSVLTLGAAKCPFFISTPCGQFL